MAALGTSRSTARELLRPEVLSHLKNLDLVARSVVEGFLIGLHRSPKFGFSQEFADYCMKATATTDDAVRAEYFGKAREFFYDYGPWMWFTSINRHNIVNKGLCGVVTITGRIGHCGADYGLFDWHWCGEGEENPRSIPLNVGG